VQQIKIDDISYEVFCDLMTYLYTGKFEALDKELVDLQDFDSKR